MKVAQLFILQLILIAGNAWGADGVGTQPPFYLGAGARELALGGAAVATAEAATASYWNAALLADAQRIAVSGFLGRLYESEVGYSYLGAAIPTLDLGCFGLGVFWQRAGGIEKRDASNLLLGEVDDSQFEFRFAYARNYRSYGIGLAATLGYHSLDDFSSISSPGFDLSLSRGFELDRLWLREVTTAIKIGNAFKRTSKLAEESFSYPRTIDVGAAVTLLPSGNAEHRLVASMRFTKIEAADPGLALGVEYGLCNMLFVRGGLREGRLAMGTGLHHKSLSFDYAFVDRELGGLHLFSMTTELGKSVAERRETRIAKREAQFNRMMNDQLVTRNAQMIEELVTLGRRQLHSGQLPEAVSNLDRALFISRSADLDTLQLIALLVSARKQLATRETKLRYQELVDSAEAKINSQDYLAAHYFAGLALVELPASREAQELFDQAEQAINLSSTTENLVEDGLRRVDSVLVRDRLEEALLITRALRELAPEHSGLKLVLARLEVERWRRAAYAAYAREDYESALDALDSVSAIFPKCSWCKTLPREIERKLDQRSDVSPKTDVAEPRHLSKVEQQDVESAYQTAQQLFEAGDLPGAITQWEVVENLAPGYREVRRYLVSAYKFVGIELYGKKQREQALAIWRQAVTLDPDNSELQDYISRTENELRKLKELSYEP